MGLHATKVGAVGCPKCKTSHDVAAREPFSRFNCDNCGAPLRVPMMLGRWCLQRELGRGRHARVYKAYDTETTRSIALKIPTKAMDAEQYLREARLMASIEHPHVVYIYEVDRYEGHPYCAMEYVDGGTVADLLKSKKKLEPAVALRICKDVAGGMQAAKERGVVHRDLKPSNILMTRDRESKVADFGLAIAVDPSIRELTGTPIYIAPEVVLRQSIDHRADIYSLGCMLFLMLTGRTPFIGDTPVDMCVARLRFDPPKPSHIDPKLSPLIDRLVKRMLYREPDRRIGDYGELISLIDQITQSDGHVVPDMGNIEAEQASATATLTDILLELAPTESLDDER